MEWEERSFGKRSAFGKENIILALEWFNGELLMASPRTDILFWVYYY
jgi:hypothetical protein